jgi:hypothetical protein
MIVKKLFISLTVVTFLLVCLCCRNTIAPYKNNDEKVKQMLRSFYTSYIIENSTFPVNQNKRDSIEKKYCTINVFRQFREDIDYDPFLKSQMVDSLILKTLTIRKDSIENNLYHISYTYGIENITVKLHVVKEKDDYKIDLVYRDL